VFIALGASLAGTLLMAGLMHWSDAGANITRSAFPLSLWLLLPLRFSQDGKHPCSHSWLSVHVATLSAQRETYTAAIQYELLPR